MMLLVRGQGEFTAGAVKVELTIITNEIKD